MIVQIKENKYDVDFLDVNVMEAVEDGIRATIDASKSLADGALGNADKLREVLSSFKTNIDAVVGNGVSEECFGESMNWVDIMRAWTAIVTEYESACAESEREAKAMMKKVSAISMAKRTDGSGAAADSGKTVRMPVKVE